MNFIIMGISEFAIHCTQALIDSGANILAFISKPESSRPNNPVSFSAFLKEKNIPYHKITDINTDEVGSNGENSKKEGEVEDADFEVVEDEK